MRNSEYGQQPVNNQLVHAFMPDNPARFIKVRELVIGFPCAKLGVDVYKRQIILWKLAVIALTLLSSRIVQDYMTVLAIAMLVLFILTLRSILKRADAIRDSGYAVSYTHLDVYNRQVLYH